MSTGSLPAEYSSFSSRLKSILVAGMTTLSAFALHLVSVFPLHAAGSLPDETATPPTRAASARTRLRRAAARNDVALAAIRSLQSKRGKHEEEDWGGACA